MSTWPWHWGPATSRRPPAPAWRLRAEITGALDAPAIVADLEFGPGDLRLGPLPALTDVRLRAHVEDGWIELTDVGARSQRASLTASGGAPLTLFGLDMPADRGTEAVLALRASNVTTQVLREALGSDTFAQIAGTMDLSVELRSPSLELVDVTGEVRLERFLMAVSGVSIGQRVPTRLVAENGVLRVVAWDWTGTGTALTVGGEIQLDGRRLDVTTDGSLDLRLLTPFTRGAGLAVRGQARPRLSITGAMDDPSIDGEVQLVGGELQLAEPRLLVSDLDMRAVLSRPTLRIEALAGQINGGTLEGGGDVSYRPGSGSEGSLNVTIDGMALEFPDGLRSEVGADLELSLTGGIGDTPLGGALGGRVTIARAAYREQLSAFGGLLSALGGDEVVRVDEGPGLADRLTLDLQLVTDEDVIVDNNYGRLQLGVDLRVIGTVGAPALSGRTTIREGGRLFVGSNVYTITQGTIDFADSTMIVPDLSIVASTRAGGEDIEVTIAGTPGNMSVDPVSTSAPELSRSDVQALLLTGRTLDELSSADAASLGVQLLGNFSGDVLGFAGRAVGLDTLRLGGVEAGRLRGDSATLATEADPTSRLTFGKSLGPNFDLTYSQSLVRGEAQTWILDYQPVRQVDLRLVSNDENLRAYSVRHEISFGQG